MTLKNKDIISLYENLQKVGSKILPVKTSFALVKNMKVLEPTYNAIIETRDSIYKTHGELQSDGTILIPTELVPVANKDLTELSEISVLVDLEAIPLSSLEGSSWTLDEISGIYPIINGEA